MTKGHLSIKTAKGTPNHHRCLARLKNGAQQVRVDISDILSAMF